VKIVKLESILFEVEVQMTSNSKFCCKTANVIYKTSLMSIIQKGLQQLMDDLNRVTHDYGIKINVKKTKVMYISHKGNYRMENQIHGQLVEQVSEFKYLCSLISEDGYYEKEIHSRIALGKKIFMDKKRLFTGKLNLQLKK